MKFSHSFLSGVVLIEPKIFADDRGFFMETRHSKKFAEAGIPVDFVQDNHSRSAQGVLRGLHYQIEQPQGKLVRVASGKIFDVVVDIRKNSPTFGQSDSFILSSDNKHVLWVPPGFAHGVYVLSEHADLLYCCTDFYAPEYERSIIWNDPELKIEWPLVNNQLPILSKKDAAGKLFSEAEHYL